jgi:hypothetical protein
VYLQYVLSFYVIYIYFHKTSVCIYFNCMQIENLRGIAQLDVRYVTIYSVERMKVFSHVSWPGLGHQGCYNMVSELHFSTLSLDGLSKLS